jgi:NADH-quinone oxidoreductase subunit N
MSQPPLPQFGHAPILVLITAMLMMQPLSTDLYLASLPNLGNEFMAPVATVQLSDLAGLGRKHPQIALLAALFLLSLTGIPPTAGFFAKAYVILSAVQAGGLAAVLAIVAVLNAAIAAFYYLRVIVYLFMRDPAETDVQVATSPLLRAGLLIAAVGTILLGLLPGGLIEAVVQALAS